MTIPNKIGRPRGQAADTRTVKIQVAFTPGEAAAFQGHIDELHALEQASGELGPSRAHTSRSLFLSRLIVEASRDRPTVEATQRALRQRRRAS